MFHYATWHNIQRKASGPISEIASISWRAVVLRIYASRKKNPQRNLISLMILSLKSLVSAVRRSKAKRKGSRTRRYGAMSREDLSRLWEFRTSVSRIMRSPGVASQLCDASSVTAIRVGGMRLTREWIPAGISPHFPWGTRGEINWCAI